MSEIQTWGAPLQITSHWILDTTHSSKSPTAGKNHLCIQVSLLSRPTRCRSSRCTTAACGVDVLPAGWASVQATVVFFCCCIKGGHHNYVGVLKNSPHTTKVKTHISSIRNQQTNSNKRPWKVDSLKRFPPFFGPMNHSPQTWSSNGIRFKWNKKDREKMTFFIFSTSSVFSWGEVVPFRYFWEGGDLVINKPFFHNSPNFAASTKRFANRIEGNHRHGQNTSTKTNSKRCWKNLQFCISPTYLGRSKIKPMVIKPMVPSSYHPLTVISLESDPSTQKWEETSSILASKSSNESEAPTRPNSNRNGCFRK